MKNIFAAFAQAVSINGIRQSGSGNNTITINGNVVGGIDAPPVGPIGTKEVAIYPFDTLEASGAFEITIRIGTEPKLTFTAEERILHQLEAYLSGDCLELATEGSLTTQGPIKADLVVTSLNTIRLSGAARLSFDNVAGSKLRVEADGAARVELNGTVAMLILDVSGAAQVRAQKLQASDVKVDISGAADVKVMAGSTIRGEASGAASVKVTGSPAKCAVSTSGAASVKYA